MLELATFEVLCSVAFRLDRADASTNPLERPAKSQARPMQLAQRLTRSILPAVASLPLLKRNVWHKLMLGLDNTLGYA
jgi:hypothetical protein